MTNYSWCVSIVACPYGSVMVLLFSLNYYYLSSHDMMTKKLVRWTLLTLALVVGLVQVSVSQLSWGFLVSHGLHRFKIQAVRARIPWQTGT